MGERKKIVIPEKYIKKYGSENVHMWSFSKISSFSDGCHWEYYLSRILHKKGVDNSYGVLGGIAHDILEDFYNGKIKYEDMKDKFEEKWLECELYGIKLYNDEEKNKKMMEQYKYDILNFFETHNATTKKVNEAEIWIDLEHGGDICIGYIDAILKQDDRYIIEDYKTSTLYKGEDIYNHQKQLLLYSLGLNQLGIPLNKIDIRWNFLKYVKIKYSHMISITYEETVKDKIKQKTSTCLRTEWVSKIKTQLKKDIVGFYETKGEKLNNKELKAIVDECVKNNSLKMLPKEIQERYVLGEVFKIARRHKYVKEMIPQLRKDLKNKEIDDITTEIKLVECANLNSLEPVKDLIDINNYLFEDAYVYGVISEETITDLKESLCRNVEIIKSKGKEEDNWGREDIQDSEEFYCNVLCSQRNNCKYYKAYRENKEMFLNKKDDSCMSEDDILNELLGL